MRPVRASTASKRKMREELLAHLTGIYEEEQARLNEPAAAIAAAKIQRRTQESANTALDSGEPVDA